MELNEVLFDEGITLNLQGTNKQEVFAELVELLYQNGRINDRQEFLKALQAREEEGVTGMGNGIAIPHGLSNCVVKPTIVYGFHPTGIEYESMDNVPTQMVFMIAVPNNSGKEHLALISKLAAKLIHEDFIKQLKEVKTKEEFLKLFQEDQKVISKGEEKQMKKIVAITSCPTGIAHTYMAAEALQTVAKEMGYEMKVETQGQSGAENVLTMTEINEADAIILAVDKGIDESRFVGRKALVVGVGKAIKETTTVIEDALNDKGTKLIQGDASSIKTEDSSEGIKGIYKHIMNGVSYMLPLVVAGGVLTALSFAFGIYAFQEEGSLAWALYQMGGAIGLGLMVPVLSAFIAHSIADRPGFAPGLIGGMIASNIGSGFLGGMLSGFIAGYTVLLLNKYIKLPKSFQGLKPVLILPIFSTLIVGLLMYFVIGTPIQMLTGAITDLLSSLTGASVIILGIVFGLLYIDLGGPLSKVLYAFAIGMVAEGVYAPMAAVMVCGMIPPVGIALATFIKPKLWTEEEREAGKAALLLGFSYITEGAIPFATSHPLVILPSTVVGGMVGASISLIMQVGTQAPHGGLFLAFIPNAVTNIAGFLIAIVVGSIVTAIMIIILKNRKEKTA